MAAFLPPAPPPGVLAMPIGCYGISYDIMVNPTERNLPHGWNSYRRESKPFKLSHVGGR